MKPLRKVSVGSAVAFVLCAMYPQAAATHAAPACGVNLGAPEIHAAISRVPPVSQGAWSHRGIEGNYNPCATLSVAIISIEGATGSSPQQAMLFHSGSYIGTATSTAYAFTSLNAARTTDDTVALSYKDGRNVCTACPGPITTVRYQWQGDHVAMLDPAPAW